MDYFAKFEETQLPLKTILNLLVKICNVDYNHAQTVWKIFSCKTLGDYHNLYLKSDVLILADVFETFRKTCKEYYNLDPVHYFGSLGFS